MYLLVQKSKYESEMSEKFLILVTNFDTGFFLLKSLEHFESISPRRVSRFCFQLNLMLIAVWSYQKFKSRPVFRTQQTVILVHIEEFCFRWLDISTIEVGNSLELINFRWLISKEFVPNIERFLPPSYLSNEIIQN